MSLTAYSYISQTLEKNNQKLYPQIIFLYFSSFHVRSENKFRIKYQNINKKWFYNEIR